jgi:hypothetical protein
MFNTSVCDPLKKQNPDADVTTDVGDLDTLPAVDLREVSNLNIAPWKPSSNISIISTEIFIVSGVTTTEIKKDVSVLYDTEIIALVQRTKSKKDGLVATHVWGWTGKNAQLGDKESKKLHELAKRYGTQLVRRDKSCT